MHRLSHDLHGSAPDKSRAALLVIDVINDFDFPEADQLLEFAAPMARRLAELIARGREAKLPVIYVNDNFGRWRSDFQSIVEHAARDESRGRDIVKMLRPEKNDYIVIKPKHSGFFSTTLDTLLEHLGVRTVILTGLAANICVLFTANDAYMRDLAIIVPEDCVASNTRNVNDYALRQMETVLKARRCTSRRLDAATLRRLVASGEIER